MTSHFKIGDKVAVLDDTLTGEVHAIHGSSITIHTNDDFLMTFEHSELVLIKGEQKEFSKYIDVHHEALLEKEQPIKKGMTKRLSKNRKQPPLEVDLHIHQLTPSTKGMDNYEMLTLQIQTAKKRLAFAIKKKNTSCCIYTWSRRGCVKKRIRVFTGQIRRRGVPCFFSEIWFWCYRSIYLSE